MEKRGFVGLALAAIALFFILAGPGQNFGNETAAIRIAQIRLSAEQKIIEHDLDTIVSTELQRALATTPEAGLVKKRINRALLDYLHRRQATGPIAFSAKTQKGAPIDETFLDQTTIVFIEFIEFVPIGTFLYSGGERGNQKIEFQLRHPLARSSFTIPIGYRQTKTGTP